METGCERSKSPIPTFQFERALWDRGLTRVAGVDEAGLGSLCGPVVAAVVCLLPTHGAIEGVRDSKVLSSAQRNALYHRIVTEAAAVGVGAASVDEIERLNVRVASHLAMKRALARIAPYDFALIDGRPIKRDDLGPHQTIVDGDALSYSIACASIVAKVTRDGLMKRLSRRYPNYGWDHNAGYGTSEHVEALNRHGLTPYHRRGYGPVRAVLVGCLSGDDEH